MGSIGVGILLLAIGAIFAFAVNIQLGALDLNTVGWILMAAGLLSLILTLTVFGRRRRTTTVVDPSTSTTAERVVEERPAPDIDRL